MPSKGGKRDGAGRPRGIHTPHQATLSANEQKAIAREAIRQHVIQHIPAIVAAQLENAVGLNYMVIRDRNGSYVEATTEEQVKAALAVGGEAFKVYKRQPNQPSAAMLLSYAADKPVEPVEVTGAEGGPLVVKWKGE